MRTIIKASLAVLVGCLLFAPTPATAASVTVDDIIYQQTGTVDASMYSVTADFTLSGNILTIVLTNASSALSGGTAATNLLAGIAFNLPTGITIANDGTINEVDITPGSSTINFSAPIADDTWGAANGAISSINNITLARGSVNAAATTLQAQMDFDLTGTVRPPANVDGPAYGILSAAVEESAAGGLAAVQDSLTITLLLDGNLPGNLTELIDAGYVVASFGSPTTVPEPSTFLLMGAALAGLGGAFRRLRLKSGVDGLADFS